MKINIRVRAVSVVLTTLALLSAPAQAQWMGGMSDQLGFYAAAAAGRAKAAHFCQDVADTFAFAVASCDEKDRLWKVSGGYQVHRNFAFELGYVHLGKQEVIGTVGGVPTSLGMKTTGVEMVVLGIIPVTQEFSVYAKGGIFRWDRKAAVSGALTGVDREGVGPTVGIGAKYDFTRNLGVRLEWQEYRDLSMQTISAGMLLYLR